MTLMVIRILHNYLWDVYLLYIFPWLYLLISIIHMYIARITIVDYRMKYFSRMHFTMHSTFFFSHIIYLFFEPNRKHEKPTL